MKLHALVTVIGSGLALAMLPPIISAQIRFLPGSEYDRINIRKPQAIQVRLEAMQSSNDFEQVRNFKENSRFRRVALPVGRLKVKVRDSRGRTGMALCTASIISSEYLLTNNHCIPGVLGVTVLAAKIEMDYLDERDTARVRSYEVDTVPIESSEALDYSIVRVRGNPSALYGKVVISRSPGALQDAVFIVHHPEGAPKTLSRKDCYINTLADKEFIHSCDTLGGSSGSPIFSDETFQMIGLHFAGSKEGNFGKNITSLLAQSSTLESISVSGRLAPPPPARTDEPPPPRERPRPPRRDPVAISLASTPPGAAIYFGEILVGATPHTFSMAARARYTFTLRKQGYRSAQVNLTRRGNSINYEATLHKIANSTRRAVNEPPEAMDRASVQMRKALDYWADMDESDFAGADQSAKGRTVDAARQRDKTTKFFGKSDFFK